MKLDAGVNGEIALNLPAGTAGLLNADAFVSFFIYGFTVFADYTIKNITDSSLSMEVLGQLTYALGPFSPTTYVMGNNLTTNANLTWGIELPFKLTKDLVICPSFSYGILGNNYFNGKANDWTLGLRFDYNGSVKF